MPVDTSIYSLIRPQQAPSIMDTQSKAMNMAGLAMRNKAVQSQLQDQERIRQEREAMRGAFAKNMGPGGEINRSGLMSDLAGINPEQAIKYRQAFGEMDAAEAERKTKRLDFQIKRLETLGGLAGSVTDQKGYDRMLSKMEELGMDASAFPAQYDPGMVRQAAIMPYKTADRLKAQKQAFEQSMKKKEFALEEKKYKQSEQEEKTKKKYQADTVIRAGQTVIRDIGTALDSIEKNKGWVTGRGALFKYLPATAAKDLAADIDSIKSNVAVDQLLKIKKSGAGLGQVPQSQLDMLASLLGGMDQSASAEKLQKNLEDVAQIYKEIVEQEGGDPFKMAIQRGYKPKYLESGRMTIVPRDSRPGDGRDVLNTGQAPAAAPVMEEPDWGNMSIEELQAYTQGG